MADKIGDSWFEYDCPVDGIDFDLEPVPAYGSEFKCMCCDQTHVADEKIGHAFRVVADATSDNGQGLEIFTHEWSGENKK